MAKQSGILRVRGSLGGLTFYKLNGQYYVRRKSSLDRKRVLRDPAFTRSRACATLFGQASQLAKHIYRLLSSYKKKRCTLGRLTAAAGSLLREGCSPATAYAQLADRYLGPSAVKMLAAVPVLSGGRVVEVGFGEGGEVYAMIAVFSGGRSPAILSG